MDFPPKEGLYEIPVALLMSFAISAFRFMRICWIIDVTLLSYFLNLSLNFLKKNVVHLLTQDGLFESQYISRLCVFTSYIIHLLTPSKGLLRPTESSQS